MKTQTTTLFKITGLLIASSAALSSANAQGVHGGGNGITQNGQLKLIDTVDGVARSARCEWKSMADLLRQQPESAMILRALSSVHAYAAQAIRSEAERVYVCLAGELKPFYPFLRSQEEYRVFKRFDAKLTTIGLRFGQHVAVDQAKFNSLSPVDRAMFLIHEISHAFVPMNEFASKGTLEDRDSDPVPIVFEACHGLGLNRHERLWSFVNAIYRTYRDHIDANEFSLAITQNGVILPETDRFYRANAVQYSLALDRNVPTRERTLAISRLNWDEAKKWLIPADIREVEYFISQTYEPALQVIHEKGYGWQTTLAQEIESKALDPMQAISSNYGSTSLLLTASQMNEDEIMKVLIQIPSRSQNKEIQARLFDAILSKKIAFDDSSDLASVLEGFDPNQDYQKRISYFVKAVQSENADVAQYFLNLNRVHTDQIDEGFSWALANRSTLASVIAPKATATQATVTAAIQSSFANEPKLTLIRSLLDRAHFDLNQADKNKQTLLNYAINQRNVELFQLLIDHGAISITDHKQAVDQDWIMTQFIEKDDAIHLSAYLNQKPAFELFTRLKALDYARLRNKPQTAQVLQP